MEEEMCHLFAESYGWTDDYILNNVALDRYFLRKDIIDRQARQNHIKQIQVAMIPHMEEKERKKIVDDLVKDEKRHSEPEIGKGTQTDFEALKRAKAQQQN